MGSTARGVLLVSLLLAMVAPLAQAADRSVEARLEERGIQYEVDEDNDYRVTIAYTDEGRTQLAYVSGGTESIGGFTVREIFAPAGRVEADGIDGDKALALLADSRSNKLGSWELAGDLLYFVIKLPDSIDAAQLETALSLVAQMADDMEIQLSGDRDEL